MTFRRFLCSAVGASALAAGLFAVPASAQWSSQPTMIGDNAVTVVRGEDSWINVAWTAPTDMENFRMEVVEWQDGTEVAYAEGSDAAHLSQDATLSAGEMDVASFKLSTSGATPPSFFIQVVAKWEFEGRTYENYPGGLDVRVVDYEGDQYDLLTDSATVAAVGDGSANWIELDFLGLAPMTSDLKITTSGGKEIYYPQETFTSLHHDDLLHAGEEDVARLWVDPDYAEPGVYDLTLTITYENNGQQHTDLVPFQLTII